MNLQELKFNRLLSKVPEGGDDTSSKSPVSAYVVTQTLNRSFFEGPNYDPKDARQLQTGTVVMNCIIQTSGLPNRVEISDNDAKFYDDSTGGTGGISGNTATIQFIRADQRPGTFIIQKRHGANNNAENVFEMFYTEAAASSQKNYVFIGRTGIAAANTTYTDVMVLHAKNDVRTEISRIFQFQSRPTFYTVDYTTIDPTKQGVVTYIAGEGPDGFSGLAKLIEQLTFAGATSFAVGDTITGNVSGAQGKIVYKISSTIFWVDHLNNIPFDPALDNACTTNGAGGGSGTGDLSATQFGNAFIVYLTPTLEIMVGNNILPDSPGLNIGSPSAKFNNIYGAIVACPLPTVENALDIIRKIPAPTEVGERGHFGGGKYFDDLTFPEEVMHPTEHGMEIEHTRMIGLLMKAVVELTAEVDSLKAERKSHA